MRVCAMSDLHGHLPPVPACDLLLLAGDLTPADRAHTRNPAAQAAWLGGPFREWLSSERGAGKAARVVGVAGNHDHVFQDAPGLVPPGLRWTYLQDSGCEAGGLKVWGSPWQPVFHWWAFNARDEARAAAWARIPDDTEVLVLHGPPAGYGDLVPERNPGEAWPTAVSVGCHALRDRLHSLPHLKLAVFGHIHSGRGVWARPGGGVLANVAVVDESYRLAHGPMTWEL